jgi:hypothetical protein
MPPQERPALILIGGLPGTGKSTLAQALARQCHFQVIRSDVVRKELAALRPTGSVSSDFGEGPYTQEMTDRTYAECLRQAENAIFQGGRVIVDANFRTQVQRQQFLEAARRWALPPILMWCEADPEIVRQRLTRRQGDVSDANWAIYQQAVEQLEPFGEEAKTNLHAVPMDGELSGALKMAQSIIAHLGL